MVGGVPVAERARPKAWKQSHLSFSDLIDLERSNKRTEDRPTELAFSDIWTAEEAFQPRRAGGEPYLDLKHASGLAEEIRKHGRPLTPIKVVPLGLRFFVIDGHHRLMAYALSHWTKPIPVEVFDGSVADAMAACSEENHRDKLPMSREDKSERAWVLVKIGVHTQRQVGQATGASERQFYVMKKKFRELGESAQDLTWVEVLRREQKPEELDYEDWVDVKAREMADALAAKTDRRTLRNVEVFSRMIEIVSGDMTDRLVQHWAPMFHDYIGDLEEARAIEVEAGGLDI